MKGQNWGPLQIQCAGISSQTSTHNFDPSCWDNSLVPTSPRHPNIPNTSWAGICTLKTYLKHQTSGGIWMSRVQSTLPFNDHLSMIPTSSFRPSKTAAVRLDLFFFEGETRDPWFSNCWQTKSSWLVGFTGHDQWDAQYMNWCRIFHSIVLSNSLETKMLLSIYYTLKIIEIYWIYCIVTLIKSLYQTNCTRSKTNTYTSFYLPDTTQINWQGCHHHLQHHKAFCSNCFINSRFAVRTPRMSSQSLLQEILSPLNEDVNPCKW